jgi:lysophospholipase L1-like esterase
MRPANALFGLSTALMAASQPTACIRPSYFVLTGDSTVASGGGWGTGFLPTLTNGANGTNPAKNGATTVSFRAEGLWDVAIKAVRDHVDDYRPIVTIQFGHNDQKPDKNISLAQYKQNLIDMADQVKEAGGTPILVTSLTRRGFGADGKVIENLAAERRLTIEAAAEADAQHLDLNRASTDYVNAIGERAWGYNMEPVDRTHLSPAGQRVFGRMLADLLVRARPDLARYVRENEALSGKIWVGEYATGDE